MYSVQKRMGRPKKRQRTEDEEDNTLILNDDPMINNSNQTWQADFPTDAADYNILTPGGSVQPWLLDFDPSLDLPPDLTPDNSSTNSPPLLNLPPELQHTHTHTHNHPLVLDPTLTSAHTANHDGTNLGLACTVLPPCACLSTMYLTLSNLQSMDPAFTFPFSLHPLRAAMQTANDVLNCEHCPQRFISAIQNTQLIGTLIMSVAERYGKILTAISEEAERAGRERVEKKFRLADLNTSTGHLHTNGIGCAAAFNLNLEAGEWRSLAKKVVRAEVYGTGEASGVSGASYGAGGGQGSAGGRMGEGHECCPYFMGIVTQMENRQKYWHSKPMPDDFPRDFITGEKMGGANIPKEDHICLKFVAFARRLCQGFDWS